MSVLQVAMTIFYTIAAPCTQTIYKRSLLHSYWTCWTFFDERVININMYNDFNLHSELFIFDDITYLIECT